MLPLISQNVPNGNLNLPKFSFYLDIRDSVDPAMFHLKKWCYHAITVNPLAGNLAELVRVVHEVSLGIIVLTLMSNPEAETLMRLATIRNQDLRTKKGESEVFVFASTLWVFSHH